MLVHAAWPCLDRKEYWAVTTKTAASGKKPRMHKANNSSIFWSLGCPFRYVDKTFVYLLFVVNQTETGPVVLYFRRDNEISACGLSSVMLPAYCLTQGWPTVQWLELHQSALCSYLGSSLHCWLRPGPTLPPLVTINVLFLTFPVFIKALCVWAPPAPILGNHHQSGCISPSGQ